MGMFTFWNIAIADSIIVPPLLFGTGFAAAKSFQPWRWLGVSVLL